MGRQAFLTRLALGRSAFEAPDESSASTEAQGNEEQSDAYVQQYDTRGNPINPKATARNLAQIEAKNQVLAAVGVVEKRDAPNDATSDPITFSEEEWDVLMEVENQYGSSIEYWARIAHDATHWWPKTVRRRLQVGLDARLPFHRIVVGEWSMMRSLGPIRGLSYFTAGVVPGTLRRFIEPWAEGLTGELCLVTEQAIIRSRMTPTWQPIWLDLVHAAGDLLSGVTQVALVTFDLFSLLQQLHLFPPQRLVFPLTALLPWHSSSPVQWALLRRQDTSHLPSPLLLLLVIEYLDIRLWRDFDLFRSYDQPALRGPYSADRKPQPSPLYLRPFIRFRQGFLSLLGWTSHDSIDIHSARSSTNERELANRARNYRLSALSMAACSFLEEAINFTVRQIILLPLETIVLRSLASAYLSSSLHASGVEAGRYAGPRYQPRTGKPFVTLLRHSIVGGDSGALGAYVGKIGLCFALESMMDCAVFGAVWAGVRWVGIRKMHWGTT